MNLGILEIILITFISVVVVLIPVAVIIAGILIYKRLNAIEAKVDKSQNNANNG